MSPIEQIPHITVDRSGFPEPPVIALGRHIRNSTRESEFLETFLGAVAERGFDNDEVVFSGFDGIEVKQLGVNPGARRPNIWVMDETRWRWAIAHRANIDTPIDYAEININPVIGVYDMNQLRVDMEGKPDAVLSEISDSDPEGICKLVTHVDYPKALPEAALQALVFFDYGKD